MSQLLRPFLLAALALTTAVASRPAQAGIVFDDFGANGEGGRIHGQTFTLGATGAAEELDAFLAIDGLDLNGGAVLGTAAQLSVDALPAGLSVSLTPLLSGDASDITLRYAIANQTGGLLPGVRFLSFIDAEIDEPPFFDEYAEVSGAATPGQAYEVDEPGFLFGDIIANLRTGSLDDSNAVPFGSPDDVSVAFAFALGPLADGESIAVEVLISEDGDHLGGRVVTHFDVDLAPSEAITYSARVVPEPGTALLLGLGLLGLSHARRARLV